MKLYNLAYLVVNYLLNKLKISLGKFDHIIYAKFFKVKNVIVKFIHFILFELIIY